MITQSTFKPLWYLKNPHLQTIVANFIHPALPKLSFETIKLPDGDTLDLAHGPTKGPDTVLILHGLEGAITSAYAQRLICFLESKKIPVSMMFFRGCNGSPNRKLRSYHSGDTEDLKSVIQHLKDKGSKQIALVGYSLGGNVTLKYMGEDITDEAVICATAVSVPLLLADCATRMNRGFSRIYQFVLLRRLIKKVLQKQDLFHQAGITTNPTTLKTFKTFDETFTAPIHGFKSANDYYQKSSSRQFLSGIKKQTLIIHAKDDPFMTKDVIPPDSELSEEITLELSEFGGHVGFISGKWFKPRFWLEQRIYQFIQPHFSKPKKNPQTNAEGS